jgi:hypothetical protein
VKEYKVCWSTAKPVVDIVSELIRLPARMSFVIAIEVK